MTKQELLKVLDMSEEEQWKWITEGDRVIEYFPDDEIFIGDPQKYLADLAFRLRDEAREYREWGAALVDVWQYWSGQNDRHHTLEGFWIHLAKPIHWIIAALIAKESK